MAKTLITVADDFGLSVEINEAVEDAARRGILTSASLMVAGPAAADAVRRARATPQLAVGLHVVAVEGPAVLPPAMIGAIADGQGQLPGDQLGLALRYAVSPAAARAMRAEIAAQFAAFARTGLRLDHANAHKHMHLHPMVGAALLRCGVAHGLRAIRIPREAPATTRGAGARLLNAWCGVLRAQARRHGMICNDYVTGLADTGQMDLATVTRLLAALPEGIVEMYFHPASARSKAIAALMPDYRHEAEYEALLRAKIPPGVRLTSYGALLETT